jgi:hypothetical protein
MTQMTIDDYNFASAGSRATYQFTDASVEDIIVDGPEVGPLVTINPPWFLTTKWMVLNVYREALGSRVSQDTIAFAFCALVQVLPPTAPPPLVTARKEMGLQFKWQSIRGSLILDIIKPNHISVERLDQVFRASIDFSDIVDIFWDWFKDPRAGFIPKAQGAFGSFGSNLASAIEALLPKTAVGPECEADARSAVADAAQFARTALPDSDPEKELTDEGILTLQWKKDQSGLILVFTGDGTGTYSVKQPGSWYAASAEEFQLTDGLPPPAQKALDEILEVTSRS